MIHSIHPIPAFTDNYIWAISSASSNSVCVVDPGDASPVLDYLQVHNLRLTDILITHHHPDHTGGLPKLISSCAPRVTGPANSNIPGIDQYVAEGDQVELFGCNFAVLEVPGHTLDHIAYYHSGSKHPTPLLFCGDTLFAAGCGRLFEGSPQQMYESLSKLTRLPGNTEVYCTHEYTLANLRFALAADPTNAALKQRLTTENSKREKMAPTLPSTMELELQTNPFLRCDNPAVARQVAAQQQIGSATAAEVFAALRAWKDRF